MERWLFLQNEPKSKIVNFAYNLRDSFGNEYDFSEFVPHKTARQSLPGYSLEECFKQEVAFRDVKLVIGQVCFNKPQIRFAFRYGNIWNDFMVHQNKKNYQITGDIFLKTFTSTIEEYPSQQQLNSSQ